MRRKSRPFCLLEDNNTIIIFVLQLKEIPIKNKLQSYILDFVNLLI